MSIFFLCFFQILLYTLGVIIACGLAVELCYQLCFSLMGRRATRVFWLVTGWLGTPIHELGHAITCLLFCHRIEYVRLWPTRQGNAMVEHSYNRRNPYAVFGNVWIALGPILAGLAVMVGILALVYPSTLELLWQSLSSPSQPNAVGSDLLARVGRLIKGMCFEQTLAYRGMVCDAVYGASRAIECRGYQRDATRRAFVRLSFRDRCGSRGDAR